MRARLAVVVVCLASLAGAAPASAQSNGRLPDSALSPIANGINCDGLLGELANPAAASYNTLALQVGRPLSINGCASAYRLIGSPGDYSRRYGTQWYFWGAYISGHGNLAARPGTSNHGYGRAIDGPPVTTAAFRSNSWAQWRKIEAFSEPWHYNYVGGFARPDPGINLASPVLRRGSGGPGQGKFVSELQHQARRHGAKQIEPDGDFGQKTAQAVEAFQRSHGLKPDRVVGPNTWSKLRGPVTLDPEPPKPAPAPAGPINGVDVSAHQGDINWDAVRRDDVEFAIVKATEGEDFIDSRFNQQRLEAIHQNGIVAGAYVYLRPRAGRPGAVEGAFFAQVLQNAGYGVGELRPVIDLEETALSSTATCNYLRSTARTIEKQMGVKPIVYTFQSFASAHLLGCGDWLEQLPLWVAAPGNPDPETRPWKSFTIRQVTFEGRVDGISGDVDVDVIPGGRDVLNDLRIKAPDRTRNRQPCEKREHPNRCRDRRDL